MLKLKDKKKITFYAKKICLTGPMMSCLKFLGKYGILVIKIELIFNIQLVSYWM